ncbi:MAG: hypothetical protein KAI80_01170 [Hyphomicrobiaceae bacterium]|nr:hypothetical protein [Hyphomicrobiaceae bacterium]
MSDDRPQRDAAHEWPAHRRKLTKTRAEKAKVMGSKKRRIGLDRADFSIQTDGRVIGLLEGARPDVERYDKEPPPAPWRCQRCRKHHEGECPNA